MRRHERVAAVVSVAVLVVSVIGAPDAQQQGQQQSGAGNRATTIDLDQLESNPEKFIGKTVTVEGEVEQILGPHLFTIDEKNWADPEREMPVLVPEPFAAIVRKDSPVRVTGTVERVPIARVERELGLIGDAKIKAEIENKPVLIATEVTANTPAAVSLRVRTDQAVGTSGSGAQAPVTDTSEVARAKDKNLVGRRVDLNNAPVTGVSNDGFWIRLPGGERIFVLSANKNGPREGQTAAVQGVVLELPEGLQVKLNAADEPIYIYAQRVTPR